MKLQQITVLEPSSPRVICSDRTLNGKDAKFEAGDDGKRIWRWDTISLKIARGTDEVCSVAIQNDGPRDIQLRKVCLDWPAAVFSPRLDTREYIELHHTRSMHEVPGVRPLHRPSEWSDGTEPSEMVTVLAHRATGEATLLGALPPFGDGFVRFAILHAAPHRDGDFGVGVQLESSRRLAAGEQLTLAHLVVLSGKDGVALLEQYASLIRDRVPERLRSRGRVTGWNSWDYYAGAVAEADVVENAIVSRKRYGDKLTYMVIDEGYEKQWGVWEGGWKFVDGLAALCEKIRRQGYEPGIWTAPLMVNMYTPLYREHPDWFVGDEVGNVYSRSLAYGPMAILDITHPEVVKHLEKVFTSLRQAGFTYFKCDFTHYLVGASTFHRNDMTTAGMLRELFRLIRRCIGDEAYLLSCGAPYESVIGIVDAHRTTGDIHHYWSHIRQNVRSMFARWWMQGAIGNTDPDFAIVRCSETTDDTQLERRAPQLPHNLGKNWKRGREMDLEEAKLLLLACYMTGGDIMLGDALGKLNDVGHRLLSRILDEPVERGVPINQFRCDGDDLPIVVAQGNGKKLMALFNLSDDYRPQTIPAELASEAGAFVEFWSGEREDVPAGTAIVLAPHSAKAWWICDR